MVDRRSDAEGRIDPSARRQALLLLARKKRLAWINDQGGEECEADVVIQAALAGAGETKRVGSAANGKQRTTMSDLFQDLPGLDGLMPSAKAYVSLLNGLMGEEEAETVEYSPTTLTPTTQNEDALLMQEGPLPKFEVDVPSYDVFIKRLQHPTSAEIVKAMQRFVTSFVQKQKYAKSSPSERLGLANGRGGGGGEGRNVAAASLHSFIQSLEVEMRKTPAWKDDDSTQWEDTKEHLEKFLSIKLHRHLFTPVERAELDKQDQALANRLQSLAFVGPDHLDVRSLLGLHATATEVLRPAILEFAKIATLKAPKDMMDCITHCSKAVTKALIDCHKDGTLPGADEFLPSVILVVKESNPTGLHTALETIQRYRHPSKLTSEAGYIFTQVLSAVHFLETADAALLNMTPEEFERSVADCQPPSRQSSHGTKGGSLSSSIIEEDVDVDPAPTATGASAAALSTKTVVAAAAEPVPAAPLLPPQRSIHDIRRERQQGGSPAFIPPLPTSSSSNMKINGSSSAQALPLPPSSSSSPPHGLRIKGLASCIRSILTSSHGGYSGLARLERDLSGSNSISLGKACSFLEASPEILRFADVACLLDEYRDLAMLAGDLMAAVCGQSINLPPPALLKAGSGTSMTAGGNIDSLGWMNHHNHGGTYRSNSSLSLSTSVLANLETPPATPGTNSGGNSPWTDR